MNWDWQKSRCCHRCGEAVPSHRRQCSVPGELEMFERVLRRIRGNPDKGELTERMTFFLRYFGRQ